MSTIPGDNTWADAGLVPPDNSAVQSPERSTVPVDPEHQPRAPRPDLRDEADEPDVVEHEPGAPRPDLRGEADEPDVVEQAMDVPDDETDEYPGQ